MKLNTKKLLTWLYPLDEQQKRRVPVVQIDWLLQDLTAAGRQSLIRLLEEKQLIFSDELEGQLKLSISSHGMKLLEREIPALARSHQEWQGDWTVLLFLEAPETDQSFRYLRNLLVNNHWFSIKRGVYLYPGELPATIDQVLRETYLTNVAAFSFNDLQFGDEQAIIGHKTNIKDLIDIYSGIGTEVKSLLKQTSKTNKFTNRQKNQFYSIFDRLSHSLLTDLGLISHYYPGATTGLQLLKQLQQGLN